MASSAPSSTKSTMVNTVSDEKFGQIYTPDEEAVLLVNNERTVMNVKAGLHACALGINSYSSGIHRIRIRIDDGYALLGIRSRKIPPTPFALGAGRYDRSPSTYGWMQKYGRTLNGIFHGYRLEEKEREGHVYIITLNCDEHRLSIINENTKEEDEMEVDVCYAPFPWSLFLGQEVGYR